MKRAILVPAALLPDALDELKSWLSINIAHEDSLLTGLLQAALETCEGFIRQAPLEVRAEEVLVAGRTWHALTTRPVLAVTGIEEIDPAGARIALDPASYEVDLTEDGGAQIRLPGTSVRRRIAVQFTAGLASGWTELPDGLRHGIIRLAAHLYRQRDSLDANTAPPAAIAALWSPWRRLRLA